VADGIADKSPGSPAPTGSAVDSVASPASPASPTPVRAGRPRRDFALLAAVAIAVPLIWWIVWAVWRGAPGYNDFHDFWFAAKLITMGHSPYDKAALAALANSEGLHFVVGTGYSYPLPFALAMIPFVALPFNAAVLVFSGIGLTFFGLTVAAWIGWAHGWQPDLARRRLLLAAGAGLYPSVYGTIANGQANLVLFPLLGLGTMALLDGERRRGLAGGIGVGLAAIVKLTPGAMAVPLLLGRRVGAAAGIVLGAAAALVVSTLLAPWAGAGSAGLTDLLEPDSYFTNQSINGFVSRLVNPSERTVPVWPHAFDPRLPMLVATVLFGLLTILVLWRARDLLGERRGLALGLGIALVAALIGAPKGTYWNQAMILIPAGLLLAVEAPDLRLRRFARADRVLLLLWLLGAAVQTVLWMYPPSKSVAMAPAVTLLQSSSIYGLLALWLVFARRLLSPQASAEELRVGASGR
jgi:Glycosyltransferase family 87